MLALVLGLTAVASGAPSLSIDAGPNGPTRDTTPEFEFTTDAETTVECSIDQGEEAYGACSHAAKHTPAMPLADGDYTFRVRATDADMEATVATRSFTVDTAVPTVSIASGPTGPTNDDTPTFGFNSEAGAVFECSVTTGGASYGPCSSASAHTPATLADGDYSFRVRATDAAGNVSTVATRTFTVDTVAPETTIDSQALGTTDEQNPEFEFSANEDGVSFECRLDSPTFTACASPKIYGPLGEGSHSFAVRATDAAGNIGEEGAESFTIDLTNPTLAIVTGPNGATNDNTPAFGFDAENGTAIECSIDQGTASWGPCSTGASHTTASPLSDGAYVFRVRATDAVPHQTTETRAFTVDTVAPDTTISGGPSGPTNGANPVFAFGSNESGVSFECRRDAESFAPCESPKAYAGLPDGAHSFRVRAIDAAGNVDQSEDLRSFTVDTVAPAISIGLGPTGTTSDNSPLFGFTVTGATTVECSIDQGTPAFGACSSPTSHVAIQLLADGAYTFRLRGSDLAGNVTSVTRSFTVATGTTKPPADPPTDPPVINPPIVPPTVLTPVIAAPRLLSPFPLVRLSGRLTQLGAKVQVLTVRAPRGATVRVRVQPRCAKGVRCPAKQGSGKVGPKGIVRFKQFELNYGAGTTIEIRVAQASLIGKYTRFVIRRGKGPQRLDQCLMPSATRASKCPAA